MKTLQYKQHDGFIEIDVPDYPEEPNSTKWPPGFDTEYNDWSISASYGDIDVDCYMPSDEEATEWYALFTVRLGNIYKNVLVSTSADYFAFIANVLPSLSASVISGQLKKIDEMLEVLIFESFGKPYFECKDGSRVR